MAYHITVEPGHRHLEAADGDDLLRILRAAGLAPDAPCGGTGRCGKCTVLVDGVEASACRTIIGRDMTVTLPTAGAAAILTSGIATTAVSVREGYALAFDIGTTTVAGFLLAGGAELASESRLNPQAVFGADVISRIRHAISGELPALTGCIRSCIEEMIRALCAKARILPREVSVLSIVGNPAMQQLILGIAPDNLAVIPFAPVLNRAEALPAKDYLTILENAQLQIVPDISGFVGADTVACVLASGMEEQEELTLLVDIGTNGEMVLGSRHRLVACSAAAGPALEGANIQCGMRGQNGAIDHVWLEDGTLRYSVIGGGEAAGICGSGLIDAVAAALNAGLLNSRGRICNEDRTIHLTDTVFLTQEDIRQVQLAKGAIAAGIGLMAAHLGIPTEQIDRVYLAGAFGTYMNPESACRIGLLPPVLAKKITAIGNAAGSGAKALACRPDALAHAQQIVTRTEFIELATQPGFSRSFAKNMRF